MHLKSGVFMLCDLIVTGLPYSENKRKRISLPNPADIMVGEHNK